MIAPGKPTRVALVTGEQMAKPDLESHLLVEALAAIGIAAELIPWQASCDWSAYKLVVIRTPWDYFLQRDAFLAWAERVECVTRLVNPSCVLRWNSHKRYLRELADHGIETVPTLWLVQGEKDCTRHLAATAWHEVVVKPAVSIGAIGAFRGIVGSPDLNDHMRRLLHDGDVMVQPYIDNISREGELSLIYFGNQFSHAITKMPKTGDYRVQDMYGGTNELSLPPLDAIRLADSVLRLTPEPTAYARVDIIRHNQLWMLMEAELIEPELFLPLASDSAERFATTIKSILV